MALEENDPMIENWLELGEQRGWDVETTAAHVERHGSPDLAAALRSRAGIARAEAATADDAGETGDDDEAKAEPRKRAPRGRRAARADETA